MARLLALLDVGVCAGMRRNQGEGDLRGSKVGVQIGGGAGIGKEAIAPGLCLTGILFVESFGFDVALVHLMTRRLRPYQVCFCFGGLDILGR